MPIRLAVVFFWLLAFPAMAQTFPSYADVTGVAPDDVLNLRDGPSATARIIGSLPPDATGVEITGASEDGRWLRLNTSEWLGWASARYLTLQPMPAWWSEAVPLGCSGVEPSWSLTYAPGALRFDINGEAQDLRIDWGGATAGGTAQALGWKLSDARSEGFALLTGRDCSDGMSERVEAIRIDLFLRGPEGETRLTGCCGLN